MHWKEQHPGNGQQNVIMRCWQKRQKQGPKIVGKKLKKSVLDQKYAPPFYGKNPQISIWNAP